MVAWILSDIASVTHVLSFSFCKSNSLDFDFAGRVGRYCFAPRQHRHHAPAIQCSSFFFQAEDGIRDHCVTGVQTCALPIYTSPNPGPSYARVQSGGLDGPGFGDVLARAIGGVTAAGHQADAETVRAISGEGNRSEERRVGKECRAQWWPQE